jgi:hypothetical protein
MRPLPAGTALPTLVETRVDRVQSGAEVAVLEGGIERVEGVPWSASLASASRSLSVSTPMLLMIGGTVKGPACPDMAQVQNGPT